MNFKSLTRAIVFGSIIAISSITSQAATISHMSSIPLSLTDFFSSPFDPIPQFDSTLGNLDSVDITLSASIESVMVLDNDAPLAITTTGSVNTNLFANIPAVGISLNVFPEATSEPVTLEADDSGNSDIPGDGGPDETTLADLMASDSTSLTLLASADDLSPFISSGDLPSDLTALAGFSVNGGAGNADISVDTLAEGKLTVVYNFTESGPGPGPTPIPEPSTVGFLAMGILGMVGIKLRRR